MSDNRQACEVCGHGPEAHTGNGEMLHDFRTDQPTELTDEEKAAVRAQVLNARVVFADQPSLRDQLGQQVLVTLLRSDNEPNSGKLAIEVADALLPLIEADRARAVAHALAARVLRDIDYAAERPTEETP